LDGPSDDLSRPSKRRAEARHEIRAGGHFSQFSISCTERVCRPGPLLALARRLVNAVDADFGHLLTRLRSGDQAASDDLYARYADALRRAVRHQLHPRLRVQFDSLDFVHDVWASFLALPADRCAFADSDALGRFLTRVARNKVIEVFRQRFRSQARDINRERPLTEPAVAAQALGAGPTPSQLVIAAERWDGLLRSLPEGHRAILERLREGHSQADVAAMLGVNVRTVERVVRRLKDLCGE